MGLDAVRRGRDDADGPADGSPPLLLYDTVKIALLLTGTVFVRVHVDRLPSVIFRNDDEAT
ncbi:hypothetical protein ACF05L_12750 [Streptomyces bobili]|uniref:hypothetical protein n=1 Tax=Streptomyces bobili TaxID=67280 RepID=UPI0036FF4DE8